jgi:hypothetical protein
MHSFFFVLSDVEFRQVILTYLFFLSNTGMHVFVAFFVLLILLADNSPPVATAIPLMGIWFFMLKVISSTLPSGSNG